MPLTYRSDNHKHISSLVKAFAFDNPKSSVFHPDSAVFTVSGWCVPQNPSDIISVFVEYTEESAERFDLTVSRPDVVSSLKIDINCFSNKNLGFEITLDTKNLKCLGFEINSEIFVEIWKYTNTDKSPLENKENANQQEDMQTPEVNPGEFLKIFSNEEQSKIHPKILEHILRKGENFFSKIDINTTNIDSIDESSDQEFCKLAKLLHRETSRNEWNTNAIKRLHNGESIFIFSKKANVHNNFLIDDINYLLLSIENNFFYLVQYCGNIGVFFPKEQMFVSFTNIESWISICIQKLAKAFYLTLEKFIINNHSFVECKFSGAILAQSRPYHFFYDGLYCLAKLAKDNTNSTPIHVKSIREKCFLDASKIFSSDEFIFETLDINSFNTQQSQLKNEFFILACNQYHLSKSEETISYLDEKIRNIARHSKLEKSSSVKTILLNSDFILWVGISSEKRKINDISFKLSKLARELSEELSARLTICFDGRTLPLAPSEQDRSFSTSETNLIRDIVRELPEEIVALNLAGMHSLDKLFIARKIDYFFCSFATDSLYVSRVFKKEGFAYYPANAEGALGMHIHPNAELVKCAVPDESIGSTWHTSDSIIDWDLLTSRIKQQILKKRGSL